MFTTLDEAGEFIFNRILKEKLVKFRDAKGKVIEEFKEGSNYGWVHIKYTDKTFSLLVIDNDDECITNNVEDDHTFRRCDFNLDTWSLTHMSLSHLLELDFITEQELEVIRKLQSDQKEEINKSKEKQEYERFLELSKKFNPTYTPAIEEK